MGHPPTSAAQRLIDEPKTLKESSFLLPSAHSLYENWEGACFRAAVLLDGGRRWLGPHSPLWSCFGLAAGPLPVSVQALRRRGGVAVSMMSI